MHNSVARERENTSGVVSEIGFCSQLEELLTSHIARGKEQVCEVMHGAGEACATRSIIFRGVALSVLEPSGGNPIAAAGAITARF
jgi:hypothetical protein